jgi:hypothetical protein
MTTAKRTQKPAPPAEPKGGRTGLKWQRPKTSPNETPMQKGQLGQNHRGPGGPSSGKTEDERTKD